MAVGEGAVEDMGVGLAVGPQGCGIPSCCNPLALVFHAAVLRRVKDRA